MGGNNLYSAVGTGRVEATKKVNYDIIKIKMTKLLALVAVT